MENTKREDIDPDIRVLYMLNGQTIFAEFIGIDENDDLIVSRPTAVMVGPNKQMAMTTAFPFSDIREPVTIAWRQVTCTASLSWNPTLIREYGNFWDQVHKAAESAKSNIEVVPANAVPRNLAGMGKKGLMGQPPGRPPLRAV
jgi:hypothetical protein